MKKNIVILAIVGAVICILGYYMGQKTGRNAQICNFPAKTDTLIVRDTIMTEKPVYLTKRTIDTLLVPYHLRDTTKMVERDTVYIPLPREQVTWQDEWAKVYASGIYPQIDSVQHFITEKTIVRNVVKKTKWSIGVQAGYGFALQDKAIRQTPYIGLGVQYNLLSW